MPFSTINSATDENVKNNFNFLKINDETKKKKQCISSSLHILLKTIPLRNHCTEKEMEKKEFL